MKKAILFSLALLSLFAFTACKDKKVAPQQREVAAAAEANPCEAYTEFMEACLPKMDESIAKTYAPGFETMKATLENPTEAQKQQCEQSLNTTQTIMERFGC